MPKASEVLIQCLEAEWVRFVFGIPGEETLDLNESLDRSSIEFVPVRHEQGASPSTRPPPDPLSMTFSEV